MSKTSPRCRTRKVLVLGTDSRLVLAVIRSLGRHNLRVHVGWCPAESLALHCKYITQIHEIPPYEAPSDAWKLSLLAILRRHHFDLVIPCNDSMLAPLQRHRGELEQFAPFALPSDGALEVTADKIKSYELARSLGVCVPRSCVTTSSTTAASILATLQLPVVVRPRSTVTTDHGHEARHVRKASTAEQLSRCLTSLPPGKEVLIQEMFRGTGVGIELLASRGEVLAAFQHVRIHETLEGGCSYRRSAPLQPELLDAARKLMKALDTTGVATVELIVDFETGRWVFLEINGRHSDSLPLAVAAGAEFPYYLYQLWVEDKRDFSLQYDENVRCRNLLMDYRGLESRCRGVSRLASLGHIARDAARLLTFRDHIDSFACDDPRPGLAELGRLARLFGRKLSDKIVLRIPGVRAWMKPAAGVSPLASPQ